MLYIVGLGNYGEIYKKNRHNAGWIFLDYLSKKINCSYKKGKGDYAYAQCKDFILFKPLTYMNISGIVVKQIVEHYRISLSQLIIVYDDADLEIGVIKFKLRGSAGSHNGMKSVIYYLRSEDVPRIRIGIGKNPSMPLREWVLSDFTDEEINVLYDRFEKVYSGLLLYDKGEVEKAMQIINTKEVKI